MRRILRESGWSRAFWFWSCFSHGGRALTVMALTTWKGAEHIFECLSSSSHFWPLQMSTTVDVFICSRGVYDSLWSYSSNAGVKVCWYFAPSPRTSSLPAFSTRLQNPKTMSRFPSYTQRHCFDKPLQWQPKSTKQKLSYSASHRHPLLSLVPTHFDTSNHVSWPKWCLRAATITIFWINFYRHLPRLAAMPTITAEMVIPAPRVTVSINMYQSFKWHFYCI